jgi:ABC-2 type transport system ATP-binding protein
MSEQKGPSPALLTVEGLRVQFGPLVAVNDLDLTVRSGQLLGLIGPNGAGKTTLLRAIATIQPLNRGVVWLNGQRLSRRSRDLLRYLGFTPDNPPVYEDLTVRQFLRFVGMSYDLTPGEIEERIGFWLERVWLIDKVEQKIKSLSRGMRQRIGIARTMLPNPAVVLLDEPAAGLDPAGRVQFRQLLASLREQGKALIVSSHILSDMAEYCSHIAIMAKGRIVQCGTVGQVAGSVANGRCRYTLVLARPVAGLEALLCQIPGVDQVHVERQRATLEFASESEEAARLLRELIGRDVPVASFSPHTPGLEEAYLRTGIGQVD